MLPWYPTVEILTHHSIVHIAVPPDILDYPTSTDMVVREGSNVTLRCAATGSPAPTIVWRREGGENISLQDGELGEFDNFFLVPNNGPRPAPYASNTDKLRKTSPRNFKRMQ